MFAKDKVSQSLIDAVNKVLDKKESEQLNEEFPSVDSVKKKQNQPQSRGGSGVKSGTRYGGGRQEDEPEQDEDEPKAKRGKYGARQKRFTDTKVYSKEDSNFTDRLIESMYGKKSAIPMDEKEMSPAQTKKKEEIVMSMKKDTEGLKKRYGSRWKDVMYATATKQAMKEAKEAEDEKEGHEDEKQDKAMMKKLLKKADLKEDGELDEATQKMSTRDKLVRSLKRAGHDTEASKKKVDDIAAKSKDAYDMYAKSKRAGKARGDAEYNMTRKEEVELDEKLDYSQKTTDTLVGRVKGGKDNQHSSYKVSYNPEEKDVEESGLRMAAHAAAKQGKKTFEFQGKTMPVTVKKEEVEELDELKKSTVSSYIQKKFGKMNNTPSSQPSKDAKSIQRAGSRMSGIKATQNEEVELDEGTMDKMSLSQLWNKHADHAILADQGYGSGAGSMTHNSKAAKAIEKHVGKHYGNEVAKDMVDHSEHSLAADEYAGPEEAPMHKAAMKKLKTKHNISEAANAAQQAAIAINMKKKGIKPKDEDSYLGMSERKKSFSALKKEMLGKDGMTSEENNNEE